ncbi:MAG: nicotinate phosphoribosyltransferase, partial [Lentisphaeraceae bacterium]|nr:nicotinate phosphoribosyltransferase [Lentisphaeraceae bacterium]
MGILKHKGAMLNDLYQITMAYGYWKNNMADYEAVFNLFYRKAPFKGSYAVFSGLDQVMELINNFEFDDEDIDFLRSLCGIDDKPLFNEDFLTYLKNFELKVDVLSVKEGSVIFPNTPIIRVQGPIIACQLLETPLLNIVNFDSLITTKAVRICNAAKNSPVFELGLRRAQGAGAGIRATRCAWIAGCAGTSNLLAAQKFGIPAKGTHAHSWVMSHASEFEAFRNYGNALPNNCTLLVDTYGTEQGVQNAIEAGREIEANGGKFSAIRLDSGDLFELSKMARKALNEAGFKETKIIASNDLDEYAIDDLKAKGARIDIYGVGTRLVTAFDQPALGGVYKISALRENADSEWQYKIKLSDEHIKVSNPGLQRVK